MKETLPIGVAKWRSRRGLLELDLFLMPFASECYKTLSPEAQLTYIRLLEQEDVQLIEWLNRRSVPDDSDFNYIVEMVLTHAAAKSV